MSINNSLLAKSPVWQGFWDQNRFKFHRVCCTQDRLPSNSCIGRAPQDVPNLPASLERGASDTTLAFLDREGEATKDSPITSCWTNHSRLQISNRLPSIEQQSPFGRRQPISANFGIPRKP